MTLMIPAWINGQLTPVEKLRAHREGLRHMAVSVFVLRGDDILIQRRALSKYHTPGLWANTCCTHPDWEEDARDCAVRRLQQELGLTGLDPQFRRQLEYRADVPPDMIEHEVVDVFVAEAGDDLQITPNPDEVAETRWISFADLAREIAASPQDFTPWLRIYMAEYARDIFAGSIAVDTAI